MATPYSTPYEPLDKPTDPTNQVKMSQPPVPQQQVYPVVQQPQVVRPAAPVEQAQVMMTPPQPQVVYVNAASAPVIVDSYDGKKSKILGILQLVAGGMAVILSIVGIIIGTNWLYYIGSGIWCSIFVFISGPFALWAASSKRKGVIIAHMVLAIVASVFVFLMLCIALSAVGFDDHTSYYYYNKRSLAVSTLWTVASLVAFIACIWSSTLGCRVVCCSSTERRFQPTPGGVQMMVLDNQGRLIPGAQVVQVPATGGPYSQGYTNQAIAPGIPQYGYPAQPDTKTTAGQMVAGPGNPPPYY